MLTLSPPRPPAKEDKTLQTLGKNSKWKSVVPAWLLAYAAYRTAKGNPWLITAMTLSANTKKAMRALYGSRGGGGAILKIRQTAMLPCCAMCGSYHNGTLDHFLPKAEFPEFSIFPSNLVPACSLCNSGEKKNSVKGASSAEWMLHPYYDTLALRPLWDVAILPPFRAPGFVPRPLPGVGPKRANRIAYHLQSVVGAAFEDHAATQWSLLPALIRYRIGAQPAYADFVADLKKHLGEVVICSGVNGWRAALLRGVLADPAALGHLHKLV